MTKSATDVMQEIIFSAVIDSILALKGASKGMPNTLLRDLNAVHANTTFADLPKELQGAISTSVRAAFTRLLKEGYSVAPGSAAQQRVPVQGRAPGEGGGPRADVRRPPPHEGRGPPGEGRRPPAEGRRPPGEGRRPPRSGPGPQRPGGGPRGPKPRG